MATELKGVELACENPCVILYSADGGSLLAATSYWRCFHSPFGSGNVLLTWFDAGVAVASDLQQARVFSDNTPLAELATRHFNQYFVGFEEKGFDTARVSEARFELLLDTQRSSALSCRAADHAIDLGWNAIGEPRIMRSEQTRLGAARDRRYEVSSVIIPADEGTIRVDGRALQGLVKPAYGALPSSAFLALAETWTRLD